MFSLIYNHSSLNITTFRFSVTRGHWLHIILVNVHAPSEEKSEELKDSFMRN